MAWVWLAIYVGVPIAMGLLWIHQARQPGIDPSRVALLPKWFFVVLMGQGVIMLLFGLVMLISPDSVIPLWPWTLSPLTCRAIGAWGMGLGVIAVQAAWENDWRRLFPTMLSYGLYGALQIINLLRFSTTLNWGSPQTIFYTGFIITIFLMGAFGIQQAWSIKRDHDGFS